MSINPVTQYNSVVQLILFSSAKAAITTWLDLLFLGKPIYSPQIPNSTHDFRCQPRSTTIFAEVTLVIASIEEQVEQMMARRDGRNEVDWRQKE